MLPLILSILLSILVHFAVRRFLLFEPLPSSITEQISTIDFDAASLPPLTRADIEQYHEKGYLIVKNALDMKVVNAMRSVTDHIITHPSGILRRGNSTKFCGFSLHNHYLIPQWRHIVYPLPISQYAAQLMNTDVVMYSQDIIHSTTSHCFNIANQTHVAASRAHSDMNQAPYSIERKRVFGDNMVVAWIALDNLDHITMELYDQTHTLFTQKVRVL